jgi:hypothetical protein
MRSLSILVCALCVIAIAPFAAATGARLPGAYASLTAADAATCARACAEDGICMAWSFDRERRCELSAVVPIEPPATLAFGLSTRAPANLQQRTLAVHADPANLAPVRTAARAEAAPALAPAQEADHVLLGGPPEADLRLGLR